GKAFVPMIIGFGCSVPAIYATRTLEDEKSRKLTSIMAPFMSCGARLPVYGLFTAAFFGEKAGIVIMSLYVLGIVVAITLGMILKKFGAFKVDEKALIIELPPYRVPSFKMIMNSTLDRTGEYLQKASTTILAVLMLLWALTYFPNNGDTSKSYMASIGKTIAPVLKPTGFADRWETVAAIPPSIAAKEIVVGFMAQVLKADKEETVNGDNNSEQEAGVASVVVDTPEEEIANVFDDIKSQGIDLAVALKDSAKGIFSFNITGLFEAPDESEIESDDRGIVSATKSLWPNDELASLKAYSFMVFILLVVPCVVTLAALKHEFGVKFMFFVTGVMIIVPYIVSTFIFQVGKLFF
ncbi:MAG: nucleoside recognition domain-containing protein, partial [Fusobacteriaceae bacterium]